MRMSRVQTTVLLSFLALAGCGDGGAAGREGQAASESTVETQTSEPAAAVSGAEIDAALAAQGAALVASKNCAACHTMGGGRLVGPDLSGVTERRSEEFILGMIVNPDSMLANDATARELLAEYFTPMSNQGVTIEDARALLEFFRQQDAAGE